MGLLVFRRITSLSLVLDLAGGIIIVMDRKLNQWQEDVRADQNQPSWGEWFSWLGHQARCHENDGPPAHIKFKHWK